MRDPPRVIRDMPSERSCPQCRRPFTPKKNRQKFCSPICARRSGAVANVDCRQCGSPFHPAKRATTFCSIRCAKLHHYAHTTPDAATLLLARIAIDPATECWNFTGDTSRRGYGRLQHRGKQFATHRLSFCLFNGAIPAGLMVCHRCDNPPCINPAHLFLGTGADNVADMHAKDRAPRSTRHGQAKLTEEQVAEIRELRARGTILTDVASRYGVSITTISNIGRGKIWRRG